MVHPVNRSGTGLQPHLLTLAELLKTCGEEVTEEMTSASAADIEIFLEERLAYHDLRRYKGTLETDADDRWTYTLIEEGNAEDEFVSEIVAGSHTKMALARCLERLNGDDRKRSWNLNLQSLQTLVQDFVDFEVVSPAPPARGRGGRGGPPALPARGRGGRGGPPAPPARARGGRGGRGRRGR